VIPDSQVHAFAALFAGRTDAYGTGKGEWIRRRLQLSSYRHHLEGNGHGLGIAPLLDDGTVRFAAIDLDEPNFEAARELQDFLSFGTTWIERSRSGNAHVWAFFEEPIEAWIPRGVMREAIAAVGKPTVEVFPKQDQLREGMVGNYINLPYHGNRRPILRDEREPFDDHWHPDEQAARERLATEFTLEEFLLLAESELNDPSVWRKRADWLMITPPDQRRSESVEFGTGKELHMCAEYIVANRDENPILEGHRNVVYFNLAKQLLHYEGFGRDEAWDMLTMVRDSADEQGVDHVSDSELRRIFRNAEQGQFTSTGCDDSLMLPYVHPDCPIAYPRKQR
jgi:hypothetical protein